MLSQASCTSDVVNRAKNSKPDLNDLTESEDATLLKGYEGTGRSETQTGESHGTTPSVPRLMTGLLTFTGSGRITDLRSVSSLPLGWAAWGLPGATDRPALSGKNAKHLEVEPHLCARLK